MLLEEEKHVITWLTQYGALPKTQVMRMLRGKSEATAEKIIRNLKKQMMISSVGDGYYLGLDNMCKPDQRMILAVWVLLKFMDKVDPMAHFPASYPAQIFFLKETVGYEIVVLYEGEEHLTRLLRPQNDDQKYIVVVPNMRMTERIILPKAPCLFATVEFQGGTEPNVVFYAEGSGNDG